MEAKKLKKLVISLLLISTLLVVCVFTAVAASKTTSKTNNVQYGSISWSFTSTGANERMSSATWGKLAPNTAGINARSTFCGVAGYTTTEGWYEATYMGNTVFTNQCVVEHKISGNTITVLRAVGV